MIKTISLVSVLFLGLATHAQFVPKVQMKEPLEGICDNAEVYALFSSLTGQVRPKCSLTEKEMEQLLNIQVAFLKENPKFKGKGMVGVFINCEGVVVKWDIDNKSKSDELDRQLLAVFQTFTDWTVGTLDGNAVDTHELISYEIKKGVLTIN